MKSVAVAVLLVVSAATHSSAQTRPTSTEQQEIRKARIAIWTGIAMVSAGAVLLPLTSSGADNNTNVVPSIGLMAAGSGVIYWGFRKQQTAVRRSNSFAVVIGQTKGIVVRRSW